MTDDDQLVERVARAICEATSGPFEMLDDVGRDALRCEAHAAITAYLSALPQRELLAEALEALDGMLFFVGELPGAQYSANVHAASAAADKIRAALTQEKQT